ncbi:MAG: purine-nucleoside phosphorylase, partial [Muribaculaceae bacterium]|nr:purine-nucleoside phosphorylase [Muribaculaceae bacterium]
SSDVFYTERDFRDLHKETGAGCVEMESFALFHNANALGKRAACLLTISDSFVTGEALSAEARQTTFRNMFIVGLEGAIAMK